MRTIEEIDRERVPQHVAIIMDGNGRWAQQQSHERLFGHKHAIQAVRDAVEAAARLEVKYLTLYAFSTENWNRPNDEVDGLMALLAQMVDSETSTLMKNNVRLVAIGDLSRMPQHSLLKLEECVRTTAANTGTTVVLALSYSARWEMGEALRQVVADARQGLLNEEEVDQETMRKYLATKDYPDPDLLIRTGGELRVSNFLLWQMAYTEFWFTELLWPDFRKEHFYEAVYDYQQRQRRFGKTGAQVSEPQGN